MLKFPLLAALLLGVSAPALAQTPKFTFAWPVDCEVGVTCQIQHYVDHGGGGPAKDYRCGTVTYKGHNGTDIRVLTMSAERAGVNVLAAAPGKVLRTRDSMADVNVRTIGHDALHGRDCGNGLVIAHADGFETQYCHMALGSLVVKAGDVVAVGQKLGHVGLSGDTEFPHLHITVRHNGQMIDPFAYGETEGACTGGVSLWKPSLAAALQYKNGVVLNDGLVPQEVTPAEVDDGKAEEPLTLGSPAIFVFVRALTLRKGDIQRIVLNGPHGQLADRSTAPLPENRDQVFLELAHKKPAQGWDPGEYKAVYSVLRDGKVVVDKTFAAKLSS